MLSFDLTGDSPRITAETLHLRYRLGLFFLIFLGFLRGPALEAAPRKAAPRPLTVARETVFVETPAPLPTPRPQVETRSVLETHTSTSHPLQLTRDADKAWGAAVGIYSAEVLGANPFCELYGEWYPLPGPYFFQATAGIGTVQSSFSHSVVNGDVFQHDWMLAFEALGGYTVDLSGRNGRAIAGGLFPYFLGGITGVWQGGVPNIGAVIGFGQRFPIPFTHGNNQSALALSIRDQIYSQKFGNNPAMTQNLVLTLGAQKNW